MEITVTRARVYTFKNSDPEMIAEALNKLIDELHEKNWYMTTNTSLVFDGKQFVMLAIFKESVQGRYKELGRYVPRQKKEKDNE